MNAAYSARNKEYWDTCAHQENQQFWYVAIGIHVTGAQRAQAYDMQPLHATWSVDHVAVTVADYCKGLVCSAQQVSSLPLLHAVTAASHSWVLHHTLRCCLGGCDSGWLMLGIVWCGSMPGIHCGTDAHAPVG